VSSQDSNIIKNKLNSKEYLLLQQKEEEQKLWKQASGALWFQALLFSGSLL